MLPDPELCAITLLVKPAEKFSPKGERELPVWWGRAAHALLLSVVGEVDPEYAEELHDPRSGLRPFTASSLLGYSPRKGLDPEKNYRIRLTGVSGRLTTALIKAVDGGTLSVGRRIELDFIPFEILAVGFAQETDSWAGVSTYARLSDRYLSAEQKPGRKITFQFSSPTAFKTGESGNLVMPVPLPEMVFNSLRNRWNEFAPLTFPEEMRRYARECLAISRYELHSHSIPGKQGSVRIGGVGRITYVAVNYDRYWMGMIATLADFARFSGVGSGTSMGLGQTRQV